MNKQEIILRTKDYVQKKHEADITGHDWWHSYRVWQMSSHLAKLEGADVFITELAALLHDVTEAGFAHKWLQELNADSKTIGRVCNILEGFAEKEQRIAKCIEEMIIEDAGYLDGIGAIGIARTFAYGGFRGKTIYDPNILPKENYSNDPQRSTTPTINHFYEKLLYIKDKMQTTAAKKIAEERHMFMESFLERFFLEWNGEI